MKAKEYILIECIYKHVDREKAEKIEQKIREAKINEIGEDEREEIKKAIVKEYARIFKKDLLKKLFEEWIQK